MSKSSLKKQRKAERLLAIGHGDSASPASSSGAAAVIVALDNPVVTSDASQQAAADDSVAPDTRNSRASSPVGAVSSTEHSAVVQASVAAPNVAPPQPTPAPAAKSVEQIVSQPKAKPAEKVPVRVSFETWMDVSCAIAGPKHYRAAQPGQDSAASTLRPRPVAISCDGKGSGSLSHFGSRAICEKTLELVDTMDYLLRDFLDAEPHDHDFSLRAIMSAFTRSWAGTIGHAALQHQAKASELETTLNAAIVGRVYTLLLQVGDGAVVGICPHPAVQARRLLDPSRGEYAGQTKFIGAKPLTPQDLAYRLVRSADWAGFACMTDGVTDLLVRTTDGRADGVAQIAARMEGPARIEELARFLTDGDAWPARFQDDRSLALVWDSCRPA